MSIKAYSDTPDIITCLSNKFDPVGVFFCLLLACVASAWLLALSGSLNAGFFTGVYISRVLMASEQHCWIRTSQWQMDSTTEAEFLCLKAGGFSLLRLLVERSHEWRFGQVGRQPQEHSAFQCLLTWNMLCWALHSEKPTAESLQRAPTNCSPKL